MLDWIMLFSLIYFCLTLFFPLFVSFQFYFLNETTFRSKSKHLERYGIRFWNRHGKHVNSIKIPTSQRWRGRWRNASSKYQWIVRLFIGAAVVAGDKERMGSDKITGKIYWLYHWIYLNNKTTMWFVELLFLSMHIEFQIYFYFYILRIFRKGSHM